MKDEGKPHHSYFAVNIDREEIDAGIRKWLAMRVSYEEEMTVLEKGNMFQQAFNYV